MRTMPPNQTLQPTAPGVVRAEQKFILRCPAWWLSLGALASTTVGAMKETPLLRPYEAIIWGPEPDSVGIRTTYFATDIVDAKKQLVAEFGENCTSSLWNEDDAAKPRGTSEA